MGNPIKIKKPLSLSNKILLGLFFGGLTGLFLGEYAYPFDYAGKAFIGLLQMTVLPYIVFSLILNIGQLSLETGKQLIIIAIKVLLVLLAFGLINLLILPFAFPEWQSSSFFSPSFVQPRETIDFISLYIPANPFYSLSANKVPAVVLFSIVVGVGLMKVPNNSAFINSLDIINKALNQVNKLVIKLTPIGVFAIAAATVGTVSWAHLARLQTYLLVYTVVVMIVTLWVLPAFIAAVTPFRYSEVFKFTRATLLTIFATGKIIVVLPQLIDNLNELFKSKKLDNEETKRSTDILLPLAYPFPNLGTLIIFIFVPFAGWYSGSLITGSQLPLYLMSGLLSSFVAPITSIPFMLDVLDLSKDLFQLFFISTVYTDRIRVVLGAMHLISLTLITTAISQGFFKINTKKIILWGGVTAILYLVSIVGIKIYLSNSLEGSYQYDKLIRQIPPRFKSDVEVYELKKPRSNPVKIRGWQTRLSRIRSTGTIRVGIYDNYLPFSYRNDQGVLIGYDIEMANLLAASLKVNLILVPIGKGNIQQQLSRDYYDIVMSGIPLSNELTENIEITHSYMDINLALLAGSQTNNLKTFDKARELDTIRVAYVLRPEYVKLLQSYLPKIGMVKINSSEEFIQGDTAVADALITSAQGGAYLALLHPEYSVVDPLPEVVTIPLVYPVGFESEELTEYVNNWIIVNTKQGKLEKLYDHWILGKQIMHPKKNWSIMKDVLHWVDDDDG
jgi:Na+/H+-dicarboxylate symporter/ABC-type amino acid transport substrate-binding protein